MFGYVKELEHRVLVDRVGELKRELEKAHEEKYLMWNTILELQSRVSYLEKVVTSQSK